MEFITKFSLCLLGILAFSSFPGAKTNSCPKEWMQNQGNCYAYFDFKMSWEDAEIECQSYGRGTHLASILTQKESALVAKHIDTYQKNPSAVWIGLHDPRENGRWRWADESTFNYQNWAEGEPNNSGGIEYCVELKHNSGLETWNDKKCDHLNTFICKKDL